MKTLGQIAYEEWWIQVYPLPIPWEKLPRTARNAWERIALVVIDAHNTRTK